MNSISVFGNATSEPRQSTPVEAYGLAIFTTTTLRGGWATPQPSRDWPAVELSFERAEPSGDASFDADAARLRYPDGNGLHARRDPAVASYAMPAGLQADEMIHPALGRVAAVYARWAGREVLHGGAFVGREGAWALIGDNLAGKSTLLGALAETGYRLVAEDVLVIDGRTVFAAPPVVDLRPEAAERLDAGELVPVRGGTRSRLTGQPGPPELTLAGIVQLEWADDGLDLRELTLAERTAGLRSARRMTGLPPEAGGLLDLLAVPAWRLARPRGWECFPETVARLSELAGRP